MSWDFETYPDPHGSLGVTPEMPFAARVPEPFHVGLADGATEVHQIQLARGILAESQGTGEPAPAGHRLGEQVDDEARFADVPAEARRS